MRVCRDNTTSVGSLSDLIEGIVLILDLACFGQGDARSTPQAVIHESSALGTLRNGSHVIQNIIGIRSRNREHVGIVHVWLVDRNQSALGIEFLFRLMSCRVLNGYGDISVSDTIRVGDLVRCVREYALCCSALGSREV